MCHPCPLRLLILVKGDQRNEMFSTDMAPQFSVLKVDTAVGGPYSQSYKRWVKTGMPFQRGRRWQLHDPECISK